MLSLEDALLSHILGLMNLEKNSFLNTLITRVTGWLTKLPFIGGFFSEGSMRQSSMNLFIAQAIYTFTIFFIDILLARTLGADDFGIWKHILLLVNLSPLILLGLPQGLNYYANLEKEKRRAHLNNVIAATDSLWSEQGYRLSSER